MTGYAPIFFEIRVPPAVTNHYAPAVLQGQKVSSVACDVIVTFVFVVVATDTTHDARPNLWYTDGQARPAVKTDASALCQTQFDLLSVVLDFDARYRFVRHGHIFTVHLFMQEI